MPDLRTYWRRFRESISYYVGGIYRYLFEKDIFLWAQAIAFKVLITVVPIVILATGIASRILGRILEDPDAFDDVARFMREYMPSFDQSDQLFTFIDKLQNAGTFFTGLGVLTLLFAAMTLFTTLRIVVGNVFQEEWHRHRTVFGGYAFDIRMAGQVGLLFVLTLGFSFLTTSIQQGGLEMAQRFNLDYVWLREGWRGSFRYLSYLIPYVLSTAMFFQLFYFIPKPHPPKRSALMGAVVTGLLWEAAKLSFTFYATSVGQFDRYVVSGTEAEEMISVLGQAFGLIIAFVFWVYYSGVVLIIGALIAVLNEKRVRMQRLKRERERMEQAVAAETARSADDTDAGPAGAGGSPGDTDADAGAGGSADDGGAGSADDGGAGSADDGGAGSAEPDLRHGALSGPEDSGGRRAERTSRSGEEFA